jgi:hypothetical protein
MSSRAGGAERGAAWSRLAIAALALLASWMVLSHVFRSAEARVAEAVEDCRTALVKGPDEEFLAHFAPDLCYRGDGDLARLKRDLAGYRAAGSPPVTILKQEIAVDGETAQVELQVVLTAGLQALAAAAVHVVAVERDGEWRVLSLSWEARK